MLHLPRDVMKHRLVLFSVEFYVGQLNYVVENLRKSSAGNYHSRQLILISRLL